MSKAEELAKKLGKEIERTVARDVLMQDTLTHLRALDASHQRLEEALAECMDAVEVFHGPDAWDIYREHSPEMKRWLAARDAQWQAAIAEQQPVMTYLGRHTIDCGEHGSHDMEMHKLIPAGTKLYALPPKAEPLEITSSFNFEGKHHRVVVHEYEPAPQGVAYLDIGAGGYVDLGSDLTPEQLQALPFGRHVLGVIGTFGVDGYAPTEPSKPVQAEPQCQGDPGECEFNKACMYRCGRLEPPVQAEAPTASNAERGGWLDANGNFWRHEQVERHWPTDADKQRAELYEVVPRAALAIQQEAQPQAERKPLTEQEIWASDSIMAANGTHTQLSMSELVEVVRAVEAAHGIAAQQATDKKGGA